MNPFDLDTTALMVWGLVAHAIADWLLQNEYMATKKMLRRQRAMRRGDGLTTPPRMYQPPTRWWDRHPAAYLHAGVHLLFLAPVFGWVAVPLAVLHLIIDCRWVVERWSKLMRQTQPAGESAVTWINPRPVVLYDIGTEIRLWNDQVWHAATIAVAALLVGALS